ncbi:MAG: GNAT family N-acetyltransferase [Rhizomicrobium sp.]
MDIQIEDATGMQAIVRNLFVPYAHELSGMAGLDVRDDGTFGQPASLAADWPLAGVYPFLLRADGRLAGFALVRRIGDDPATHEIGEFFVLRKYRRTGVGKYAACALFDRFPGHWDVRELLANIPAQAFWRRIIADYTGGDFEDRQEYVEAYGREFVVQRFRSTQVASRVAT